MTRRPSPSGVLYVDGTPDDDAAAALESEFGYDVRTVRSLAAAVDAYDADPPDCVVCGPCVGDADPVAVLRTLRERDPYLPFVAFASPDDAELAADALDAGASDVATTRGAPGDHAELCRRVDRAVARCARRRDVDLLDSIFESLPAHLYVKDAAARHVRVSETHVDDPSTFIGRTDRDMSPEYFSAAFAEASYRDDRRVIDTGERLIDEEQYLPQVGVWDLTSKVPWRGPDGAVRGLIGLSRPITERKEAEMALRRQNERLDEFANIVSHDLRSPLSVATGYLELAREQCDGDAPALDRVGGALDRMNELVEDVLTLAREGNAVVDPEPVALADAVDAAWRSVDPADATLRATTDLGRVRCDEPRLRRLLENLFRNCVEHGSTSSRARPDDGDESASSDDPAPDGAPAVTVTVGRLDGGFYVADDGPGIPEDDRESVFEPGNTSSPSGTGFGLAIVEEIAEAHGWTVSATEADDGGARFEVTGVDPAESS